jgi:Zn-dependent peptidase ImmA (M78 family)
MHTLASRVRAAFPFVGERAATEDDLLEFCAGEGVAVVWSRDVDKGIYAIGKCGRQVVHAICLNTQLIGWSLLYVLAHEIGHYLLHAPSKTRTGPVAAFQCRREHREAETVAALLLLPIPELEAALISGHYKENEDLAALIGVRLDARRRYGE